MDKLRSVKTMIVKNMPIVYCQVTNGGKYYG